MTIINFSFFHGLVSLTGAHWQANDMHLQNMKMTTITQSLAACFPNRNTYLFCDVCTSIIVLQPLVLLVNSGAGRAKPALLMHTSMPWCWTLIQENMDIMSSSTDRSHLYGIRVPLNPPLTHSAASFCERKNTLRFTFHKAQKPLAEGYKLIIATALVSWFVRMLYTLHYSC